MKCEVRGSEKTLLDACEAQDSPRGPKRAPCRAKKSYMKANMALGDAKSILKENFSSVVLAVVCIGDLGSTCTASTYLLMNSLHAVL